MKKTEQHFVWVDVTRIVATLFVVLLHTFTLPDVSATTSLVSLYLMVLAKVGVPLFVMLSGALLLPKQEPWVVFYKKRLERVLIPWLVWSVIVVLLRNLTSLGQPLFLLSELKHVFIAEFTFLPLIFCLYLLVPIFQLVTKYGGIANVVYILSLWFLAIGFLPFVRNSLAFPLAVDNGLVTQTIRFSGYLLAGWLLSQFSLVRKKLLFLLGGVFLLTILWSTWLTQSSGTLDSPFSSYLSPWIIMASMTVFCFFANLEPYFTSLSGQAKAFLKLLGRASFGVFLVHGFIKQLVAPVILRPASTLSHNLLVWTVVALVSFGLITALLKIGKVGKYFT